MYQNDFFSSLFPLLVVFEPSLGYWYLMDETLYDLNFKQILVVLTHPEMRQKILDLVLLHELDVHLKFVNSYSEAGKLINLEVHDPYDHIILNLNFKNKKLDDFLEFIYPLSQDNPNLLIEYIIHPDSGKVSLGPAELT